MERRHPYRLIEAALVVDNLSSCVQIGHILPTNEAQCRELAKLPAEQQPAAWLESVKRSPKKRVPPASTVKGVVQEIKQRDNTPAPISYSDGDVVEIRAGVNPNLRKHDGCWGVVTHVGTWNCTVHISVRNVDVQCLADEMDKVDPKLTADIRAVSKRIAGLMQRDDLSRMAMGILEILGQQTCFSPDDLWFLEKVEQRYEIT